MSIVASNLKLLREEANLSIAELSERSGIAEGILSGFENDQFIPNEYQLEVLCQILHMPYEDIATRDLLLERQNATRQMKNKENRANYNWYFGSKKNFILFLTYLIFFIMAMTVVGIFTYFIVNSKIFMQNAELLQSNMDFVDKITLFFKLIIYIFNRLSIVLTIIGVMDVVYFAIYYYSYHTFTFHYWYIFLISFFLAMLPIIGLIGSWVMAIYCLIRLIKGRY